MIWLGHDPADDTNFHREYGWRFAFNVYGVITPTSSGLQQVILPAPIDRGIPDD
jgi:hypothetical protein